MPNKTSVHLFLFWEGGRCKQEECESCFLHMYCPQSLYCWDDFKCQLCFHFCHYRMWYNAVVHFGICVVFHLNNNILIYIYPSPALLIWVFKLAFPQKEVSYTLLTCTHISICRKKYITVPCLIGIVPFSLSTCDNLIPWLMFPPPNFQPLYNMQRIICRSKQKPPDPLQGAWTSATEITWSALVLCVGSSIQLYNQIWRMIPKNSSVLPQDTWENPKWLWQFSFSTKRIRFANMLNVLLVVNLQ